MRIWIVNPHALPPSENGGTRHYSLSRELVRMGNEVVILASDIHYSSRSRISHASLLEDHMGVKFAWITVPPYHTNGVDRLWNHLLFSWRLGRKSLLSRLAPPDLVVGSSPHIFGAWAASNIARDMNVPFVFEIRDLWPQAIVDIGGISKLHPAALLFERMEAALCRRARHIISLMPKARDYLVQRGVEESKVTWIPNGVDFSLVDVEERPPAVNRPMRLMYVGSHGESDSLDILIDATEMTNRAAGKCLFKLILVGDGPEKSRLRARVREERMANIEFRDPVPKRDVYRVMSEADAFVLVARHSVFQKWGASFNKLYDYMAVGRPIIFCGTGGRLFGTARIGLETDDITAESLSSLMTSLADMMDEEIIAMGETARKCARTDYSIERLARCFYDVCCLAVGQ